MLHRAPLVVLLMTAVTAWAAPPTVPDLLRLIPGNARAVVAVDAAALRAQPPVQQWLLAHQAAWSSIDDDATRFLREAGVDPAHDIDRMVFAVTGTEPQRHLLALFAGRYDPATLTAALRARGAAPVTIGHLTAYRVGHQDGDEHAALIAFTPELVMVGDREALAETQTKTAAPVRLVQAEKATGHLDLSAPFWMAVEIPEDAAPLPHHTASGDEGSEGQALVAVAAASAAVRRIAAWATLSEELRLHAFATTTSGENAGLLRDTLRGALAAMRLAVQDRRPELVAVLRGVEVNTDGTAVTLASKIPVDLLQQLATEAHHHHEKPAEAEKD